MALAAVVPEPIPDFRVGIPAGTQVTTNLVGNTGWGIETSFFCDHTVTAGEIAEEWGNRR